jgi:hypothetical protein
MTNQKGGTINYPKEWAGIAIEIDHLLRRAIPAYEKKDYITPGLYIDDIKDNPDIYPLMRVISKPIQKRYISYFLRDQGRKKGKFNHTSQVWVLPEVSE